MKDAVNGHLNSKRHKAMEEAHFAKVRSGCSERTRDRARQCEIEDGPPGTWQQSRLSSEADALASVGTSWRKDFYCITNEKWTSRRRLAWIAASGAWSQRVIEDLAWITA